MGSVIITGASSGFGRAAASLFAAAGHPLVLLARRKDRLEEVEALLQQQVPVHIEVLDVRDPDGVAGLVERLPDAYRPIDVLLNNAGLALGLGAADQADLADWDIMVDTNIKGLMYCTRAVLPVMVAQRA